MHATMCTQSKANIPTILGATMRNVSVEELQFDDDFFSTVTNDPSEREVAMSQFEVMSMDDLPSVGDEDAVYTITSTLDQYKWSKGNYTSHNPYMSEAQNARLLIVDESAYMPHGGAVSTRLIYNIWALRADLALLARQGLAYEDVLQRGSYTRFDGATKIRHKYMLHNHKALVSLLREHVRVNGKINHDLLDRVAKIGVDLWVAEDGAIGFKDGTFVVSV